VHKALAHHPDDAAQAMCATLTRVIVEVFSYCNRTCSFCSNAAFSRRGPNRFMRHDVYGRILRDLACGRFAGSLGFGRYSEPLSHPSIFVRIAEARTHLPDAHLFANTNGDFVSAATLDELAAHGLDELKIMHYLPDGERFTTAAAQAGCEKFLKQRAMMATVGKVYSDQLIFYNVHHPRLRVSLRSESYSARGTDRGGLVPGLSSVQRGHGCRAPAKELNIDFDGSVVPCCNIRSDAPSHEEFILGNVATASLP